MVGYRGPPREYDDDDLPEPEIDVCTCCGAYFDWDGIMRQNKLSELGITDGADQQRCYKCLEV